MKLLILSLLLSTAAFGTQCTQLNNITFCDNGTSAVQIDNQIFFQSDDEDYARLEAAFNLLSKAQQKQVLKAIREDLQVKGYEVP